MTENLGADSKARLAIMEAAIEVASKRVRELEVLRTLRSQQAAALLVQAQDAPLAIAQAAALSTAIEKLIVAIDKELVTARAIAQAARDPYNQYVEIIGSYERRIGELSEQINRLTAERDGLKRKLSD